MRLLGIISFSSVFGATPLETSQFNLVSNGWQPFEYGEHGTEVYAAFNAIDSEKPMLLRITDVSRPGSAFKVMDNGKYILTTSIPSQDSRKGPTSNPWRAFNSNSWSHGLTVLSTGFHHIRVFMRYSPWKEGLGAIMAEPLDICEHESGGMVIVKNLVDWDTAERVCRQLGGRLANLRCSLSSSRQIRTLNRAFSLIKKCKVENDQVWIGGTMDEAHADDDLFPASAKAFTASEGITGSEWEQTQMGVLCRL